MVNPVRAGTCEPGPEDRQPRGANDERQAVLPPGAIAAAEFHPRRREDEREPDEDRDPPLADQPEQESAYPTQSHREIA